MKNSVIAFTILFNIIFLFHYVKCERFFYFAYGSNLLAKRLHIKNPSAEFNGIALLEDYRLDFNTYAKTWHGAVATIVQDPSAEVWGALWTLDKNQMEHLDRQECVHIGIYYAKNVNVTTSTGQLLSARTYEQTQNPPKLKNNEELPYERRPSLTYHQVIVQGAVECDIPHDYIRYLYSIVNNGRVASKEIRKQLGPPWYCL